MVAPIKLGTHTITITIEDGKGQRAKTSVTVPRYTTADGETSMEVGEAHDPLAYGVILARFIQTAITGKVVGVSVTTRFRANSFSASNLANIENYGSDFPSAAGVDSDVEQGLYIPMGTEQKVKAASIVIPTYNEAFIASNGVPTSGQVWIDIVDMLASEDPIMNFTATDKRGKDLKFVNRYAAKEIFKKSRD